jgi:hypothetical protein
MNPLTRPRGPSWILGAIFLCTAGMGASQELPEGEGKQQVEQLCTSCHSLQPIISVRHTEAEWRTEVDNMVGLGAQGSDEDFSAAVAYLSRHYGKSRLGWPIYGTGVVLLSGVLLLGRYRRVRRNQPKPPAAGRDR